MSLISNLKWETFHEITKDNEDSFDNYLLDAMTLEERTFSVVLTNILPTRVTT